ncbi:MAG: TetR/AcrR family transcriptional regulator [Mycetocola sp.]
MTAADAAFTPEPRGYAKGRARRDAILHTASVQFAEKGFLSATILEIAAACTISRAGLLHYFADKDALLDAVLEARDIEDQERFAPYVAAGGAIGVLRGMVDLADYNRFVPGLIELFVRLSSEAAALDHPAHDYFLNRYERIRTGTARALAGAARAGYLRSEVDPGDAAVRLTALMDGLQAQWLLDRNIDMSRHIGQTIQDWLTPEGASEFEAIQVSPTLASA